ncbi:MAG: hypothetical protein HC893_02280 [Chloroflexaceae bacterium]|nr:hypothetical protein [Chloroflexaceae bacterium]
MVSCPDQYYTPRQRLPPDAAGVYPLLSLNQVLAGCIEMLQWVIDGIRGKGAQPDIARTVAHEGQQSRLPAGQQRPALVSCTSWFEFMSSQQSALVYPSRRAPDALSVCASWYNPAYIAGIIPESGNHAQAP